MSTEKPQAASITVTGRVQRVGYRRYILDIAQELGVSGYIRNMGDGSVKIFCQAPPAILQQFIEKAENPPPPAQIKQFEIKETKPRPKLKNIQDKIWSNTRRAPGRLRSNAVNIYGLLERIQRL